MSTLMDDQIKRWTAKRKSALVVEIFQGKTTVAEASRTGATSLPIKKRLAFKGWTIHFFRSSTTGIWHDDDLKLPLCTALNESAI